MESYVAMKEYDGDTREVVWEWSLFDHTVQDIEPAKENYGNVSNERLFRASLMMNIVNHEVHPNAVEYNERLTKSRCL